MKLHPDVIEKAFGMSMADKIIARARLSICKIKFIFKMAAI